VRERLFLTRLTKALTAPRRIIQFIAAFPRVAEEPIAKPMPSPPIIKAKMVSKATSLPVTPLALSAAHATITSNPKTWVECEFILFPPSGDS
jgi:hypothetical protein